MFMSGNDYRESLRRYAPRVYVNGRAVESVADEPLLAIGVNGLALSYDYALREDLALGIAMIDGKGDRTLWPAQQPNRDAYVHIAERRGDGIVIAGAKAIVTGAPYMRAAGDAVPEHDRGRSGFRRVLRGAGGRGEPDARRPAGGTPRRAGGRVQREVRAVHRAGDLRPRVRPPESGCSLRGSGSTRGLSPISTRSTTARPASRLGAASAIW
jgi:hypothetical protein